jgi:2-keto-4-pentenoate hydratase/2-oxohepta-3-ene-1,7-dioic acid hydratase in catechol pathway
MHYAICMNRLGISNEGAHVRLARFVAEGAERLGFLDEDDAVEVRGTWPELVTRSMAGSEAVAAESTGRRWPLSGCRLLAPLDPASRGVFCVGMNYSDHVAEIGDELGRVNAGRPPIFLKLTASMLAPDQPLVLDPLLSSQMDWEVELGVVIGIGGRHIAPVDVHQHVAGYTVVIDTTARDLQQGHVQWFMGKNAHQSSPIGPWITTVDEVGFPPAVDISLSINDVDKQQATTDQLIWSIADLVSITSSAVELQPGDVFATGSPPGVGFTRTPPEFLTPGDVVRAEIKGVGSLSHVVK